MARTQSGSQTVPTTGTLFQVQVNAGSTSGSTPAGQTFNLAGNSSDVYTLNTADPTHQTTNKGDTFYLNSAFPTNTIIQDGSGPNTLNITGISGALGAYTPTQISGVQTINVTHTTIGNAPNFNINAAGITGANVINDLNNGTGNNTITNLAGTTALGISGETVSHADNVTYAAGSTAAQVILGADGTGTGANAGAHTITLTLGTGATNTIASDTFVSNGANQVILGAADSALTTINHSGSASFALRDIVDTALTTLSDTGTGPSTFDLGVTGFTAPASGTALAAGAFTGGVANTGLQANAAVTIGNGADTVVAQFQGAGNTITAGNGADTFAFNFLNPATANTATETSLATINLGTGADTISIVSASHQAVTLTAGNGADTLNLIANAAHNVTVGTGADTFNVTFVAGGNLYAATANQSNEITSDTQLTSQETNITGFGGNANNTLHLAGSGGAATALNGTQLATVAASSSLVAAADAESTIAGNGKVVAFMYGNDTYVEQVANAGHISSGDTLVHLVGVTDPLTALNAAHFTAA